MSKSWKVIGGVAGLLAIIGILVAVIQLFQSQLSSISDDKTRATLIAIQKQQLTTQRQIATAQSQMATAQADGKTDASSATAIAEEFLKLQSTQESLAIEATQLALDNLNPSVTNISTHTPIPAIESTPTLTNSFVDNHNVTMMLVPAGQFEMGRDGSFLDEKPTHDVWLDGFYIDQYEVTNAQYSVFLAENGNQIEGGTTWLDTKSEVVHIQKINDVWTFKFGYDDHPVVEVTWYGAQSYCQWREARLPTEAEWEKAARSTDGRSYPWGNDALDCEKANYWRDDGGCVGATTTVGTYPMGESPYGIMDMVGNVWEWVSDWYDADYYGISDPNNPEGPEAGTSKVIRGGSCCIDDSDFRVTDRNSIRPSDSYGNIGFRCVTIR